MKIVAFMQNMWVRDPARVVSSLASFEGQHGTEAANRLWRNYVRRFLFAGCQTGRRLKAAFGEPLCEQIVWEESTREVCGNPRVIAKPQPAHIRAVLQAEQPLVVMVFGKVAARAVLPLLGESCKHILTLPHPAARQATVVKELEDRAAILRGIIASVTLVPNIP